jgi:ferric-dicitrate binding protein FerR (iron transport regulator)
MKENPLPYSDEKAYRIAYLVLGFIRKTLTEAEHDELDAWVEASDHNMLLFEELTDEKNIESNIAWMQSIQTEEALEKTKKQIQFTSSPRSRKRKLWSFIAAAAVVIAVVAMYLVRPKTNNRSTESNPVAINDVLPGGNKATLTLSDGSVIDLGKKSTGIIQNETATKIEKTADGLLMYEKLNDAKEIKTNTLSIPRGGQYALTLSDGTKVWLNALSSLKFPEQFPGSERIVELSGEAFFEVSKDKQHPFIVKMPGGEQVKVLGTQFNVLSYGDEETKRITLIEGSVNVTLRQTQGENSLTLKPGQQASIKNGNMVLEKNADTEAATGWKNGAFVFRDADIYSIMRQAERWYDVNVIYRTTSSEHFNFSISRNEPISKILHLMELTGKIHFKIENKTVYVLP